MKVLKNFTHFQSSIKNQKFKLSQIPVTGETVNLQLNQSIGLKVLRHSDMQKCDMQKLKAIQSRKLGDTLFFTPDIFLLPLFQLPCLLTCELSNLLLIRILRLILILGRWSSQMPLQLLLLLLPLFLLRKVQYKTIRKLAKLFSKVTILDENKLSAYFFVELVIKGASAALKSLQTFVLKVQTQSI